MKKFSKITKVKVNSEEPVIKVDSNSLIKYSIHKLIKEFLHIRIEGPIDPILQGTLKLQGEEEFIESLLNLFKSKEITDQLNLLNEAKFNGLDNSIYLYENMLVEKQTKSMLIKHDRRIEDIIMRSQGDDDKAIKLATTQSNRIKNGEKAFYRGLSAERLIGSKDREGNYYPKKVLKEISDIFIHRSKQLGYTK